MIVDAAAVTVLPCLALQTALLSLSVADCKFIDSAAVLWTTLLLHHLLCCSFVICFAVQMCFDVCAVRCAAAACHER